MCHASLQNIIEASIIEIVILRNSHLCPENVNFTEWGAKQRLNWLGLKVPQRVAEGGLVSSARETIKWRPTK